MVGDLIDALEFFRGKLVYYEQTPECEQYTVELDHATIFLYNGWVNVKDKRGDLWVPRERVESITPEK